MLGNHPESEKAAPERNGGAEIPNDVARFQATETRDNCEKRDRVCGGGRGRCACGGVCLGDTSPQWPAQRRPPGSANRRGRARQPATARHDGGHPCPAALCASWSCGGNRFLRPPGKYGTIGGRASAWRTPSHKRVCTTARNRNPNVLDGAARCVQRSQWRRPVGTPTAMPTLQKFMLACSHARPCVARCFESSDLRPCQRTRDGSTMTMLAHIDARRPARVQPITSAQRWLNKHTNSLCARSEGAMRCAPAACCG